VITSHECAKEGPVSQEDANASTIYEREWQQAVAASEAGRLEDARHHLAEALTAAQEHGDDELIERVVCGQAAVALALGDADDHVPRLCAIVLRNRSNTNAFLAANNVARACELQRDNKKGLFYARIARERAEALAHKEWVAAATNPIGNLLLADSYFESAAESYRQALALLPEGEDQRTLIYLANLGYCELVLGHHTDGMRHLYRCLRVAKKRGWKRLQMIAHVDICFGQLELGRYEQAEQHGRRGLTLAESTGESDWVKNALYLLGEVAVLAGSDSRAYAWFHELQRRFYPEQRHLPDFLISVDIRRLINLRA
jgi:tetratricopeptide (TPR) repeat protein